ncbi:MAG: GerMN domain-containing protein [Clostridiales bacterium]|nr:GerMN domain-containing protein [Clostridiales bacterium]
MKIKRADIERILILCAAALVVVLALRGNDQTTSQVLVDQTVIPIEETMATETGETVSTVVFYEDGEGYLVPVTRQVAKTEGIAKATLSLMVKESQNDMQAARMGLRTVIPEGTNFEIDIADGRANVNVSKEALNCSSAEQESLMVDAITNAMSCFATVEEVTLEFDGQKRSKLTYGTDVSGVFSGSNLNLESIETFSEDANLVQLYFPSQTGRLLVPVTRSVFSDADPTTAMIELAKGPKDDSGLERALPENCGIKGVTMKDGVVTVNFSQEFKQTLEETDGGNQTVRAILFTCSQFPGVKQVQVLVDGEKLEASPDTQTTFINVEEEVIAQYPGVIEVD